MSKKKKRHWTQTPEGKIKLTTMRNKTQTANSANNFSFEAILSDPIHDIVNHPKHYTSHPSGVECIQVAEHFNLCLGAAIQYIWRFPITTNLNDLRKAAWYINREIKRIENGRTSR
jgi:hypothetical protein